MMTMSTHRPTAGFIMVPCQCGRMLRAKHDQLGLEIVCWDCRAAQIVESPRARVRFLSGLARSVYDLFDQEAMGRIAVGSTALIAALAIPYAGVGLAGLLLVLGAAIYGEVVLAPGVLDQGWPDRLRQVGRGRWACGAAFAAGTVVPLWLLGAGVQHSPRLSWAGLAVLAITWVACPAAMLELCSRAPRAAGGRSRLRDVLREHPLITVAVLAIGPLTLLGSEFLVANVVYQYGALPLFALDYMPIPGQPLNINGILFYGQENYAQMPAGPFNMGYLRGLRQGYSLVGSIPPSLSLDTRAAISPRPIQLSPEGYLTFRLLLVGLIGLAWSVGFAIQARCFNVLTRKRNQPVA